MRVELRYVQILGREGEDQPRLQYRYAHVEHPEYGPEWSSWEMVDVVWRDWHDRYK